MELKTSNVAKRLGVSTKTIQRWVKKYDIPCEKNEAGHYVFDAKTIAMLEQIKFEQGAALEDDFSTDIEKPDAGCPESFFETYVKPYLEELEKRLRVTERKLEQKADDVVSFQLLQHRNEIDELADKLHELEHRISQLETVYSNFSSLEQAQPKPKRRGFSRIVGLFM